MIAGIITRMLSGFLKELINFVLSLFFATRIISNNGNGRFVRKLSTYVCNNMTRFQGSNFALEKNFDKTSKECETLVAGQRTMLVSGINFFWYKGTIPMWVSSDTSTLNTNNARQITKCHINTFRYFSSELDELCNQLSKKEIKPEINIRDGRDWERQDDVPNVKTYIGSGVELEVIEYLKNFKANEEEYKKRGRRYKTGILLHGPPGTGKNSVVYQIAIELGTSIYTISAASLKSAKDLQRAISESPPGAIIYIEDMDPATLKAMGGNDDDSDDERTRGRNHSHSKKKSSEGPTKVLQHILDGTLTPDDGKIFIISTNNEPLLKEWDNENGGALFRRGRIDRSFKIDYATDEWIEKSFAIDYPNAPKQLVEEMIHNLKNYNVRQSTFSDAIFWCVTDKKNVEDTIKDVIDAIIDDNKEKME